MIKITVPGKIHLLGEHAVVYGKPALLTAIDLTATITLSPLDKKPRKIKKDPYDINAFALHSAIEKAIQKKFSIKKIPPYLIRVESDIPIGYGLGSSAAISAGYTAALLSHLKIDWDLKLVNEIAYQGEKIFHGNPSGADNTTVIFGGFVWYRKELESLKVFHTIEQKIHPKVGQFFLIDSSKPAETTKDLVKLVSDKRIAARKKYDNIFDDQEQLTKDLLVALVDGETNQVVDIIKKGQRNLEKIGVVGKKAQSIIREVEKNGGAGKILGGGGIAEGSGMLLAYHPDSKQLLNLLKEKKWKYIKIKVAQDGLKLSTTSV
jgi:mevalonate kinase